MQSTKVRGIAMVDGDGLYAEVGRRIRDRRVALGLTQDSVASAVGLTRTSVTNIEKGRQKILLHTLCNLAEVLRMGPADLLPRRTLDLDGILKTAPDDERQWVKETVAARGSEEDTV